MSKLHGGCASQLYFSGMDIDTARMLRETLGEVSVETLLANGRFRKDKQPLMTSAAIRSMADNEVIYLYGNKRPMRLKLTPYYEQAELLRRTKTAYKPPKIAPLSSVRYVPI